MSLLHSRFLANLPSTPSSRAPDFPLADRLSVRAEPYPRRAHP